MGFPLQLTVASSVLVVQTYQFDENWLVDCGKFNVLFACLGVYSVS